MKFLSNEMFSVILHFEIVYEADTIEVKTMLNLKIGINTSVSVMISQLFFPHQNYFQPKC